VSKYIVGQRMPQAGSMGVLCLFEEALMFLSRFKYYGAVSLVLGLLACQPSPPAPVSSGQPLQPASVSPPERQPLTHSVLVDGDSIALPPEVLAALEHEYAGFKTQALSENYLRRKVLHFIATGQGEAMRREIEFARYRHPDLLMGIMQAEPDVYTSASEQVEVQAFRTISPDFDAYMVLLSGVPVLYTNDLGMTFAPIPAGSFLMGRPDTESGQEDEAPQHEVYISAFQMQTTEVTQGQWLAVMGSQWPGGEPCNNAAGFGPDYPMMCVSWHDAQSFVQALNQQGLGTYRLPSEAEWEYAARAGTTTRYACPPDSGYDGDSTSCLAAMGWYSANSADSLHPVAQKLPNAWGLYDVHGNVREWVQDGYQADYYHAVYGVHPRFDPSGPDTATQRVLRGGDFSFGPNPLRIYRRYSYSPSSRFRFYGFRLVYMP